MNVELPVVSLGTTRVHAITQAECIELIIAELDRGNGGWVLTTNVDHLWWSARDDSYERLCARATITVADGMPLVWMSHLLGTPLPERVAGSDLISNLSAAAAQNGRSVFLLGGERGTAEQAAESLRRRLPGIRIVGTFCPDFGFLVRPEELARVKAAVRAAAPDILYVALDKPDQTRLLEDLHHDLPRTWAIGVGISFSFLAGRVRRAPRWMQRFGLEWLHRVGQEPRRLWKRYLLHDLPLAASLLTGAALRRLGLRT